MNPVEAPRHPKCRVCTLVAVPQDVTIRLYDPELAHIPLEGAVEYLRAVGLSGTNRQLQAMAITHRRHVDKWMERGAAVAPALIEQGVQRIAAPIGDTRWVDLNQSGMDLGAQANAKLRERIATGGMEDKDLVSIARMGQGAAKTRAELEMKGALKRAQEIAKLASGFSKPAES